MPIKSKRKLPPDPEELNNARAAWGAEALLHFTEVCKTDMEDALCDLLCDLRHWADRNGTDWQAELDRAMMHYNSEITTGL